MRVYLPDALLRRCRLMHRMRMCLRVITAVLLAALLLLLPSFAARCDLQCNVSSAGHAMHVHHGMPGMAQASSCGSGAVEMQASTCRHEACLQKPAVLADLQLATSPMLLPLDPSLPAAVPVVPALSAKRRLGHGPPSHLSDTPLSLHTMLRI